MPFCWESLAAWGEADAAGNDNYFSHRVYRHPLEVDRFNYRDAERYEVGWYRRTFTVPKTEVWQNRRTILIVGAADFFTDCWCNGQHVGRNEVGYIPFEFDLTDALELTPDGELIATIVFRVEDPQDNREQPVGKQWGWYSSVSGIWQTVFLEPRAATFVERFEITTDVEEGEAAFTICTNGGRTCHVELTAPDGRKFSDTFAVEDGQASGTLSLQEPMLWDPIRPHLYHVQFTLGTGPQADVVHGYFGCAASLRNRPMMSRRPRRSRSTAKRSTSVARSINHTTRMAFTPLAMCRS